MCARGGVAIRGNVTPIGTLCGPFQRSETLAMASVLRRGGQHLKRSFFNRSCELSALKRTVAGESDRGNLLLLTGPPDSGKSALLEEFSNWQWTAKKGFPITINMRAGTFNTAASFAQELKAQATSSILPAISKFCSSTLLEDGVKDTINESAGSAPVAEVASHVFDGINDSMAAIHAANANDMQALIKGLEDLFSIWQVHSRRIGHGLEASKPTLIIDEANRFHEWSLSPSEQQHLATLQAWITMITKEKGIANVILCSSEDFFRFWMNSHIGSQRYLVGMVGDLTKEEALRFFKERLCKAQQTRTYELPDDLWNQIYDCIGGRMHLLKLLAGQLSSLIKDEGKMRLTWIKFWKSTHDSALLHVQAAYSPASLPVKWSRPPLGPKVDVQEAAVPGTLPMWTKQEYVAVLKKIAEARDGVVSQHTLVKENENVLGKDALYSLIQHNYLHFRGPYLWGGKDLEWYTGGFPIIMPTSKPHFHAIKAFLAQLAENQPPS